MYNDETDYETPAETETGLLPAGERLTLDEMAVELSAIELRLRQLARAAETPETPVELEKTIESLRNAAAGVRRTGADMALLARVVAGDVPLAAAFDGGDGWGGAAVDTDREDYGGPAIVPTAPQLWNLAQRAELAAKYGRDDVVTTTYPEAMSTVPASILRSWESKAARGRRDRERAKAIEAEIPRVPCETAGCGAGEGELCRTRNGRAAEQPHTGRRREAVARVDARLGYVGPNPVAVPER